MLSSQNLEGELGQSDPAVLNRNKTEFCTRYNCRLMRSGNFSSLEGNFDRSNLCHPSSGKLCILPEAHIH